MDILGNQQNKSFIDKAKAVQNSVQDIGKTENKIYLFMSFDLVNSTKLKTDSFFFNKWTEIISDFYEKLRTDLTITVPSLKVWKYVGDEILLYFELTDLQKDIVKSLHIEVLKIVSKVSEELTKHYCIDNCKDEKLRIKATMWIAETLLSAGVKQNIREASDGNLCKNIEIEFPLGETSMKDFLGVDIDTGFRIAKYSYYNSVTLSARLAYLLLKDSPRECTNDLLIMSYQELKGVWNGRFYPIIWYFPKESRDLVQFDEHKKIEELNNLKSNNYETIEHLEAIIAQKGELDEYESFVNKCHNLTSQKYTFI